MVDPSDRIYVKRGNNIARVEDGFKSVEEVEEFIDEEMPPGDYEYGLLSNIGETTVEEEEPEYKEFTTVERQRLEQVIENAENDSRIKDSAILERKDTRYHCSVYSQNVRYVNGEPDFKLSFELDMFDDPPVSTIDWEIESDIRDVFEDITEGVGTFLGYDSSYASRGRRNPFVVAYGRIHREDEKFIRRIHELDSVQGIFWTSENISPVPIYTVGKDQDDEYLPQDYIVVLDLVGDDTYEDISDAILSQVDSLMEEINAIEPEVEFDWIGKTAFKKEYHTIAIGVSRS